MTSATGHGATAGPFPLLDVGAEETPSAPGKCGARHGGAAGGLEALARMCLNDDNNNKDDICGCGKGASRVNGCLANGVRNGVDGGVRGVNGGVLDERLHDDGLHPAVGSAVEQESGVLDALEHHPESRVLVLYTGGTIGMVKSDSGGLAPLRNRLAGRLRSSTTFHDNEYSRWRFGEGVDGPLVLPASKEGRRVLYTIREYDPLLDSSCMGVEDWVRIATDIKAHYEQYDGFLVLHGTDTLAYTASALSFMLENLGKTVIVTGSQIPLWELRSDGRDNLLVSLLLAGCYVIPEVSVMFGARLLRGNRTVKVSAHSLRAFDTPNFPPLATIGINIDVDHRLVYRPKTTEPFTVHCKMNNNVGLLRIFPNISTNVVRSFLAPPLKGAVLQTYGAGNVPGNRTDLLEALREAAARGIILVNCTQCMHGQVADLYAMGKVLYDMGVVAGADMTPEAALSKLSYVLSKDEWDLETKKERLRTSLRGELTAPSRILEDWGTLDSVVRALGAEPSQVAELLIPAITCAAAARLGAASLAALIDAGADPAAGTMEGRTPLHVASYEGNLEAVRLLLQHGAGVHVKDRFGRTPLLDAVQMDRHEVITALRSCGAHLGASNTAIGDKICSVAAVGDVKRLKSFRLAGADLGQRDVSGRTPLHVASQLGRTSAALFLVSSGVDVFAKDLSGRTAAELARAAGHSTLANALSHGGLTCS
ncbi:L-asparaginase-like [Frankliniella occidentalis]|uniref:asparaginase n=1 Tax=Frankliniella occidentalis TaxID=133901 RepID=A0A6J1SPI4_FRAOC|nr:L-asparaginase-like [Frankliniella occidentalis]